MDYLKQIGVIQKLFKPLGYEIVVGGGIAYDAYIGKITRVHDDLDVDIVGSDDWNTGFKRAHEIILKQYPKITTVKNKRIVVEKGEFEIDVEYVQAIGKTGRTYRYGIGEYTYPANVYLHNQGKIDNHVFTIENPHLLFVIKLLQPILGEKSLRPKDIHDIDLIRPHLNMSDLIKCAHFELEYFKNKSNKTSK